ncbi:hypothetical protein [Streptacidiphilus sp. P02-A3a]|uniref:hypothetical protein n=1 Tax=Streptacidiphilus sp. P02-A3a TaxID=2704468 RepID=UPI0015F7A7AC|nr:hypothetical protein [Streptacidiphilus sp. P02-A3a]QMU70873.1 hypothetical protein GXP74_24300 [Streptacidiphilus sp. P02-A3a]
MRSLVSLALSIVWDRSAMLWRLTVESEPVAGEDGNPLGWARFNDAYDVKVAQADLRGRVGGAA